MHPRIDFSALARHALEMGFTTRGLGLRIGLSQPAVSRLTTGRTREIGAHAALGLIRLVGGRVELPERLARPSQDNEHKKS